MKALRIALGVIAILAIALAAAAYTLRKPLAERVFRSVVADTIGRDRTADLADGLHVYLCGTGSPMPDPQRAGPCVGVLAGKRAFLFDIGSGGARRLARMGFPVGQLERVYLSHLHSDHFDGLGEILLQAWVGGSRSSPLPISGPVGVEEVVAGFNAAYRIDSGYRTAHHGAAVANPAGFGGVATPIQAPIGPAGEAIVVLDDGGVRITAVRVNHGPIEPAYGYRIEYGGTQRLRTPPVRRRRRAQERLCSITLFPLFRSPCFIRSSSAMPERSSTGRSWWVRTACVCPCRRARTSWNAG
jgi:ribonuclease Z